MKIQPINSTPNLTNFQKKRVSIPKNIQPQEPLTFREEINRGYTRGIIGALIMIAAIVTCAIIKEHKQNEAKKQQIETVKEPDARLGSEVYLDNIKD